MANLHGGEELAIRVRNAVKGYGRLHVLKGLNMDVPYGSIYGLLGSSGCGKTTLLRCILGRLNLADGDIVVLGQPPGSRGHQIPGKDVGYMPQEMALYGDFTMHETLHYFGILHGMSISQVRRRTTFLLELLELPLSGKLIRKLSGGQQRRFSFAVAMLQEPPLLILDEPTVGVDPLLRSKIWHHLLDLTSSSRTTVIITTHYIEEARQAHTVGLMRDGKLLAQAKPASLIQSYHMSTLEEVFLLLCRRQEQINRLTPETASIQTPSPLVPYDGGGEPDETTPLVNTKLVDSLREIDEKEEAFTSSIRQTATGVATSIRTSCRCSCNPRTFLPRPMNVLALAWKNTVRIYRNPGLVLFQFILPALQVVLFCLAVGRHLRGVNMTYFNADQPNENVSKLVEYCSSLSNQSNFTSFGDLYMQKLLQDNTFHATNYSSLEEAIDKVKHGDAWVAVGIQKNFTMDLMLRVCSIDTENEGCKLAKAYKLLPNKTDPDYDPNYIDGSSISLYADITNAQITVTVSNQTLLAYELFLDDLLTACGGEDTNKSAFSAPIKIEEPPVYGKKDLSFTDYMGPGIITSITFGISIGLCAVALIIERNEGLIDRTWVAGVNVPEIIIAQVFTQFFIIVVQIVVMVAVIIWGFKIYNRHLYNIWLIGFLAMVQGLTGMAFGLFLSGICNTENAALQAAVAAFYPTILLSGVIWPLEGMPIWLQYISGALPATYPAEAMRAIMGRGWGFLHLQVWRGFAVSSAWFLVFLFAAGLALSIRK